MNGPEIKQAREARGWSQQRLAEAAGTNQQTVDRIERGSVEKSRALPQILRALGVVCGNEDEVCGANTHSATDPRDHIIVGQQAITAVYRTPGGAIAIWQDREFVGEVEILFTSDEAVGQVIAELQNLIGDVVPGGRS